MQVTFCFRTHPLRTQNLADGRREVSARCSPKDRSLGLDEITFLQTRDEKHSLPLPRFCGQGSKLEGGNKKGPDDIGRSLAVVRISDDHEDVYRFAEQYLTILLRRSSLVTNNHI